MSEGEVKNQVSIKTQALHRSGASKLLHMMQWTRPEIMNRVRKLYPFARKALQLHIMAMYQVTKYSWIPEEEMTSNIFNNNLSCPFFEKHGAKFV
jgi:hypothetical protein